MILAHDFARRALADDAGGPDGFAPEEKRYLDALADPRGSRAARRLAKELVAAALAALGRPVAPAEVAILPAAEPGGGPPRVALPAGAGAGLRLHLSLSHSAVEAAAWLVVESED